MIRRMRYLGDKIVRSPSERVGRVTPEIKQLIKDMEETLAHYGGIGLAAPQIGVLKRVIIADVPESDGTHRKAALVNPEIVSYSGDETVMEEGCLCVPGVTAEVPRMSGVKVRGLDASGRKTTIEAEGLFARCLMHEIDHLDGIIFIDRAGMSELEAIELMKKFRGESAVL